MRRRRPPQSIFTSRYCDIEILERRTLLASGAPLAVNVLGGPGQETIRDVKVDVQGYRYVLGTFSGVADVDPRSSTANLTSAGGLDLFVAKYTPQNALVWARRLGGKGDEIAGGLAIGAGGDVFVSGGFTGTADFDSGDGTVAAAAAGKTDIFAWRLSARGKFCWAYAVGGTGYDVALDLELTPGGSVFLGGTFRNSVDFRQGRLVDGRQSAGARDGFLTRLDAATGIERQTEQLSGAGDDIVRAVQMSADQTVVYVGGSFAGTTTFDSTQGSGTQQMTSLGATDGFVAGYLASNLGVDSLKQFGSGDATTAVDDVSRVNSEIVFAGTYSGTAFGRASFDGSSDLFVGSLPQYATNSGMFCFVGSTGEETAPRLVGMSDGTIYVAGGVAGTPSIGLAVGDFGSTLRGAGGNGDIFLAHIKVTRAGAGCVVLGGAAADVGTAIAYDPVTARMIAGGSFTGAVDFDYERTTKVVRTSRENTADAFLAEYGF